MQMTGRQYPDLPTTKISQKGGRPSDCGYEEKEEVAKRKLVGHEARPSTATSEKGSFNFSVFISFRGEDTRNGFTSHLHKEFKSRGIRTFIDSEDLDKGQRINHLFNCIKESKIFVPVFSKAYVGSQWCLKEITKMVEINKMEGENRPIIPIFYHVNPSDLKHCKASFERDLEKHQCNKELGEEQINEWKATLAYAGNISGYCLSETEGNEAKLITLIAAQISKILSKVPFDIQPIGISSHINILKQMLEKEKDDNCMIGICGLGGLGKTTIAMALYNELSPTFQGSCFLSDIREKENKEDLPSLQAKLMNEVLGENMSKMNVREGVTLMRERFGSMKVLLILDDVDDTRQLEAFVADRRKNEVWFGVGSKIIITTRNKDVLLRHGLQEDDIYTPQELDPEQALQLFFRHAFVSHQLQAQLGNLPQEIVNVAGGLPLALIVFGSHFSLLPEKNKWEETLERLKREQNEEVHKRLKISYESLNHQEKLVFLDIACFFIGETKEYPIYMWEACDCSPRTTLKVLQHKSLIKINQKDRFEMHDQIRDMGRMVIAEEGKFNPLKYSRPWNMDQTWMILEDAEVSQENRHIQSIKVRPILDPISWKAFTTMPELRIINYTCDQIFFPTMRRILRDLLHIYKKICLPTKLQFLCCRGYGERIAFSHNQHEQLRVLDLACGTFRAFRTRSMVFPQLKVLDLYFCIHLVRTPDFTNLSSLEVLRLELCISLAEMDDSIRHLKKLVTLNMRGCYELKGLPTALCQLISLEFLDVSDCRQISELPEEMGNMKSLRSLIVDGTSLKKMPDSIRMLVLDRRKPYEDDKHNWGAFCSHNQAVGTWRQFLQDLHEERHY